MIKNKIRFELGDCPQNGWSPNQESMVHTSRFLFHIEQNKKEKEEY